MRQQFYKILFYSLLYTYTKKLKNLIYIFSIKRLKILELHFDRIKNTFYICFGFYFILNAYSYLKEVLEKEIKFSLVFLICKNLQNLNRRRTNKQAIIYFS